MALVLAVISFSTIWGSRLKLCTSISIKTGLAPSIITVFAVATKEKGVVITSSPVPTPAAWSAQCRAAVPEFTAIAYAVPQ